MSDAGLAAHLEFGFEAERAAERHLAGLGYEILDRNFRAKCGELDLIARDGETVVFVEVRARDDSDYSPLETVGPEKRRKLIKTASLYAMLKNLECPLRFDVVAIHRGRLEHVEDAFTCG
jgi:putative endonuclease